VRVGRVLHTPTSGEPLCDHDSRIVAGLHADLESSPDNNIRTYAPLSPKRGIRGTNSERFAGAKLSRAQHLVGEAGHISSESQMAGKAASQVSSA